MISGLNRLNVANVDEELAYPANSGKRIRALNLLMRLAQRHRITYLSHRNREPAEAHLAAENFRDQGVATVVADRPVPPKSGFAFYGRLGANLFSGVPYSVASHNSALLRQAIHDHATRHSVDLWLKKVGAYLLCCHGYKAGLVGLLAARRVGIPVVAVSRGWTGESFKVRLYERLARLALRWMDRVVCVSQGQAAKVRRAGVAPRLVVVIPNAVNVDRFSHPDPLGRAEILRYFSTPPQKIVAGVGRLSREKGFDILVRAAAAISQRLPSVGVIVFGEGPLRDALAAQVSASNLEGKFILAGFRTDLDRLFPHFDLLVLSSYTEGMPNAILEAFAAGVPAVATAVGGTPEVIREGIDGYLVHPGNAGQLADRIVAVIHCDDRQVAMGRSGKRRVLSEFTFQAQSVSCQDVFKRSLEFFGSVSVSVNIAVNRSGQFRHNVEALAA